MDLPGRGGSLVRWPLKPRGKFGTLRCPRRDEDSSADAAVPRAVWKGKRMISDPRTNRRALRLVAALPLLAVLSAGCGPPPKEAAARLERIDQLYETARFLTFADVPEVTVSELTGALARGEPLVLVDVREPAEWEVSMIPGAVTEEQFERDLAAYRHRRIVTYCTIGGRAGAYAKKLRGQGLAAEVLKGSILAWTHAGRPLVGADGRPTKRVHVYKESFNLAAEGYEPTW